MMTTLEVKFDPKKSVPKEQTAGLTDEDAAFLAFLSGCYTAYQNQNPGTLATKNFEVTWKVARVEAEIDVNQLGGPRDELKPVRRGNSPVFNCLVQPRGTQAATQSAGDPCCWWEWDGTGFVCVAMCD